MMRRVMWYILIDVSEELTAAFVSAKRHLSLRNLPEDSHIHVRRCENLKSDGGKELFTCTSHASSQPHV
jgi:hypothetical protein